MKKLIFFTCLTFCFVWQANAQIEFAPLGAKWYYYCYQYTAEKDTVVNGKNCRMINHSKYSHLNDIVYEEEGKVYYLFNGVFRKVFDFNVEIGDNVQLELMYITPLQYLIDTVITYNCFVDEVSYENIGNLQLKSVKVSFDVFFGEEGSLDFEQRPWSFTYYERIGLMTDHYFLPIISQVSTLEDVPLLGYQDNILTYVNEFWIGVGMGQRCDYPNKPNSVDNVINEQLSIYPNPFNDNIFVSANNGGNIEIVDIFGKIIYCSELSDGINEISTSHFFKGIYFAKIQNKDNSTQIFKIIKL